MSVTTPTNIDTSIPEVWASAVLREHLREGFWGRFVGGEGSGMPIIQKTELLNKSGDRIHIQITAPLSGSGVSGDTAALEGNEEALSTTEIRVEPVLYRHGVRINRRANKKSIIELREEAKMRLAEWGMDKMDDLRFSQFVSTNEADVVDATYTPNQYFVGHPGGAIDDIVAADKLTVDAVRNVRYQLMSQKARPFKVNGLPFYAMVISPEQELDLKQDADYQTYVTSAAQRGMDNPVFTGAIANIEGVVLYPHFNVPTLTNANGVPARVAKALAFGGEAFLEGVDEDVMWVERDHFDYGLEWGVAYSFACQARRALELSSLQVVTAAALPAVL